MTHTPRAGTPRFQVVQSNPVKPFIQIELNPKFTEQKKEDNPPELLRPHRT
jgi:hypothetical protein